MRKISFRGTEHATAFEALQDLDASGREDRAIQLAGRFFTVTFAELYRLEGLGIELAILSFSEAHGRLFTIPVN